MQKDRDSKSKLSNIIAHSYHDFFVRIISYYGKICPIKHGSHDTHEIIALPYSDCPFGLALWKWTMAVTQGRVLSQLWRTLCLIFNLRKKKINFKYLK